MRSSWGERARISCTLISGFSRNWRITFRRYSYESASSALPSARAVAESPLPFTLRTVPSIEAGGLVTDEADNGGETVPPPIVLIEAIDVLEALERVSPGVEACDMVEK